MKKFLMLLAASYIPGVLLLLGEWPKALGFEHSVLAIFYGVGCHRCAL